MTDKLYIYFRHCPKNWKGERLSICGYFCNNVLKIGIARCSKKDQFEKAKAREISTGRAQSAPIYIVETENPKAEFTKLYRIVEENFNNKKETYEKFLESINQSCTKDKKVTRKSVGVIDKIKSRWNNLFKKEEEISATVSL